MSHRFPSDAASPHSQKSRLHTDRCSISAREMLHLKTKRCCIALREMQQERLGAGQWDCLPFGARTTPNGQNRVQPLPLRETDRSMSNRNFSVQYGSNPAATTQTPRPWLQRRHHPQSGTDRELPITTTGVSRPTWQDGRPLSRCAHFSR